MKSLRAIGLEPYRGELDAFEAASGIQAARLNAQSLLATSQLLLGSSRWGHALALAVLANEEAGKVHIILQIFLRMGEPAALWKAYRTHTAKTGLYNFAIASRAQATLGPMPPDRAAQLRNAGPTPEEMDATKQILLYSDCYLDNGRAVWRLPGNEEARELATQAVNETSILVNYLRDYSPDELKVWKRHWDEGRERGLTPQAITRALQSELLEKGFISETQWQPILHSLDTCASEIGLDS